MIYVRYVEKYSQRHGISRFLGEFCNRWRQMTMTNSPSWPNLVWCFACLCHVKGQGIVQTAQIYPPQNSHSHWKQAIFKRKIKSSNHPYFQVLCLFVSGSVSLGFELRRLPEVHDALMTGIWGNNERCHSDHCEDNNWKPEEKLTIEKSATMFRV